jgi:hypothetical protein
MENNTVLIDSDAFIGFLVKEDGNHARAEQVFKTIQEQRLKPAATNLPEGRLIAFIGTFQLSSTKAPGIKIKKMHESQLFEFFENQIQSFWVAGTPRLLLDSHDPQIT